MHALQPNLTDAIYLLNSESNLFVCVFCVRRYRCDFKFEQFIGSSDEIDQSLSGWHCVRLSRIQRFKYF